MRTSCPLVPEAPEVCSAETGKEKVSAVTCVLRSQGRELPAGAGERDCWPPGPGLQGPREGVAEDRPGPGCRSSPARCLSPQAPEVTLLTAAHLL